MQVDDHSLGYADYEGTIEEGYGAGQVIVWDKGTYRNLDQDHSMGEALDAGHATFWLEGHKLSGGWTLQRRCAPAPSRNGSSSNAATRRPMRGAIPRARSPSR